MAIPRLIGVLGGMGPLATVDFMQKVIEATSADRDQDHVPMIVYSVPQIPDRVSAILAGTDEPVPAILAGVRVLEQAGVELIVMPCNTAHAWYDQLAVETKVPILHMADAVRQRMGARRETVALLATRGTLQAGFYQRYLSTADRTVRLPDADAQDLIGEAIAAVKIGDFATAQRTITIAGQTLLDSGADRLLLAFTELPLAAKDTKIESRCIDATVCLAEACVAFALGAGSTIGTKRRSL